MKVPFEFVVGGATLPAGTYTVDRLSVDALSGIVIRSFGYEVSVLPQVVDATPAGQPKLSFEHLGDKYSLSETDTPEGIYNFALPRANGSAGADEESRYHLLGWHSLSRRPHQHSYGCGGSSGIRSTSVDPDSPSSLNNGARLGKNTTSFSDVV
jgi:hypothetical protein